jgi:hypothetical protein
MGYRPVGIDPSLKGIRAARQVALHLGMQAHYVAADGRYLPFANGTFDQVLPQCAAASFQGECPPHIAGGWPSVAFIWAISCANAKLLWHSLSLSSNPPRIPQGPRFRCALLDAENWPRLSARSHFRGRFLFAQPPDQRCKEVSHTVVYASEALRRISGIVPPLTYLADSLYVEGTVNNLGLGHISDRA